MKKGFTFIELLIVIAIISALSIIGMMRISAFQKDALIDSVGNEIISTLKLARSKSQMGEVPPGQSLDNISEGPSYGITPYAGGYDIFARYTAIIPNGENTTTIESFTLPNSITISISNPPILFERISGKTAYNEIDINYKDVFERKIVIYPSGYFDIQ